MKALNTKLTAEQFARHALEYPLVFRRINKLIFHHTSSPVETWKASGSMLHYFNLYNSRGWKAGPHIFVAPDGIWLFTPINKQGRHAGKDGNKGSIGIEIVGRYFDKLPDNPEILKNLAVVTQALMYRFFLDKNHVTNHKHVRPDSHCSPLLTPEFIMQNIAAHRDYLTSIGL